VPYSYYDTSLELALRPTMVKADAEEEKVVSESLKKLCARFDEITVPVVIVTGDLDTYAMEQAPRLDDGIPNSKVIVVEGAHHFLWFSYPSKVTEAIQEAWMEAGDSEIISQLIERADR
jgi:pimeloyl-ACP methyl ester carboxylesterase